MICGCILLIAVVLSVFYTAIYTAQVAAPHYQVLAKSIEEVAANPNIKVYTTKDFAPATYLMVLSTEIQWKSFEFLLK